MKTRYMLILVAAAVIVGLTGCPGSAAFNPFLGGSSDTVGDATTEQGVVGAANDAESVSEASDGFPFQLNSAAQLGNLENLVDQLIEILFDNGVVDVDSTTAMIPGLSLYPLSDAAADEPYARGTALAYTAVVVPDGTGSRAVVTVDLTSLTTEEVEVAADPAAVLANGGTKMLNGDGDDVMGETEDAQFAYLTLDAGGLPAPTGQTRSASLFVDPNFITPLTPAGFTLGSTLLTIAGFDVGGGAYEDQFTAASIGGGITLFKLDPATSTWNAVSEGARAYDDVAGDFTITLTAATVAGEIYQARYNRYNIMTSAAVRGFVQRDYNRQNDSGNNLTRTDLQVINGATEYATVTGAADNGSADSQISIDVTFGGGVGTEAILTSTITQSSVRIFFKEDPGEYREVGWDFFAVTDPSAGANVLTFWLPVSVDPDGNDDYKVVVSTAVQATGNIPVLDVTERLHGLTEININN